MSLALLPTDDIASIYNKKLYSSTLPDDHQQNNDVLSFHQNDEKYWLNLT